MQYLLYHLFRITYAFKRWRIKRFTPIGQVLLIGLVVSAIVGLLAFVALIRVVKAGKLHYFSYYCWALGLLAMTWLLLAG